jgi:hypothetical protein
MEFNGVMPGHSHVSDEEIASIASFVRFTFGSIEERPITPEEVKTLRPEVGKRKFFRGRSKICAPLANDPSAGAVASNQSTFFLNLPDVAESAGKVGKEGLKSIPYFLNRLK